MLVGMSDAAWLPIPAPGEGFQVVEMVYEDLPVVEPDNGTRSGVTLAGLLEMVGGYEGQLEHPFTGEQISVSLEHLRDRDPESTWLYIAFN
jgi:hypothetical protein